MSAELEQETIEPEITETEDTETEATETAETETPEQETTETEKDPKGYTKAINKKHYEVMEERRRNESLQAEIDRLKEQVPQPARPEVPAIPDPFDENYEQNLADRDEAVRNAAAYDAQQSLLQQQQQYQAQQAQQQQQAELNKMRMSYSERAEKLGVDAQELQVAANIVADYRISDELTMHILNDDHGPAITTYLARHPNDMEKLSTMTPIQAGIFISTEIKDKAKTGTGISNAPDPAETLSGGGAAPKKLGPKGATYE